MSCNTCYDDWLCKCTPYDSTLRINSFLPENDSYLVRVTDVHGNIYDAPGTWSGGDIDFNVNDFPDGLFSTPGVIIKIQILIDSSDQCSAVRIPMLKFYDCIDVLINGGNAEKSELGCELPE